MPQVRDAIKIIQRDGWYLSRTRGSHRQYKHAFKRGTVTIAGHLRQHVKPKTWASIMRQAGLMEHKR